MQKKFGATLLVAGTCLGGGMIALPMVLAKIGLIPSIILMLVVWALMYYISLVHIELNIQAKKPLSVGGIGKHYSGKLAEMLGFAGMKILTFALLAVFIYGLSSVIQKLLGGAISFNIIASYVAVGSGLLLLLPLKLVDYVNRMLFLGLLVIVAILVAGLTSMVKLDNLPLFAPNYLDISIWKIVVPVVVTSFAFQAIIPTVTSYCEFEAKTLKSAFTVGSFIPLAVYMIWTCSVLIVVHSENPSFYNTMLTGNVEIGDMISELSRIAKWESIQVLVWWISILAIYTSLIGIGLSVNQSVKEMIGSRIDNCSVKNIASTIITILPPYIVAILVPNAFIAVLAFASILIVITAILLPIYLLNKANLKNLNYKEVGSKFLLIASVLAGIIIMAFEAANIF